MHKAPYSVTFVRHGESEWNKMNLFCGWHDVGLSEEGEWDALEVSAAALKRENMGYDIAFTSCLRRANQTLDIILKELNLTDIPVRQLWRLNERHYGALTGFNKRQMADIYGEEQVQVWRRSFNVPPPAIEPTNPYYHAIKSNPRLRHINEKDFPLTETLETTMERVVPEWTDSIIPEVRAGKRVLVVAHGTSLRGLVKHIQDISDADIMKFNLPNSIPFIIDFDESMKMVGGIRFLANDETVLKAMEKVASIGGK
ncbi:2,3-bisphosphoglycerate-dependent phosphoglycerate mutase-like isoform X1 [Anopheles stephensi]|uniref:2,3-bisphosphoglycerate-dependent phosphoglycerate mutase-like isoform X1 n=1 Tax=Anopheles stephensi TaxID=30069 RepID=UPI001658AE4E|nr:2,3-bisphosphoglycerate-dependent phosphoglycerate mutase-like isoform X1 [Anopheles stephensi]XP_035919823.1 2,3-bisphosphoglycerate-dependent phosphoglycerate mutase-like isoform X1 [Anopheles stephensi]